MRVRMNSIAFGSAGRGKPEAMRFLRRSAGTSLIELLIGLAIASLIAGAAVVAIHQILAASAQANDMQLAISQVRAAEHWMTRDILTTQTVTYGIDDGFPLTLDWTDVDSGNHEVEYALVAMPSGGLHHLTREYTDPDAQVSSLTVASYIDSSLSSCALTGTSAVQITLVATARSYTATRAFDAMPRSD